MNKQRRLMLIGKLNKLGTFYSGGNPIENLTLYQLEYLHITKLCEQVTVIRTQTKRQPVGSKLAFGKN